MSEPIDDPADLVPDYLTGGLTSEEERALFASAAANQDIFNQLMEAEALRDALSSPEQRNRLKAALEAWEGSAQPQCVGDCDDLEEGLASESAARPPVARLSPSVHLVALSAPTQVRLTQRSTRLWYTSPRAFAAIAAGIVVFLFVPYAGFRWMQRSTYDAVNKSVRQMISPQHSESSATADSIVRPGDYVSAPAAEPDKQAKSRPPQRNHVDPLRGYDRGQNVSGPERPVATSASAEPAKPPAPTKQGEPDQSVASTNSPNERKEETPGRPDSSTEPTQVADARPKPSDAPSVDTLAPSGNQRPGGNPFTDLLGINIDVPPKPAEMPGSTSQTASGSPRPSPGAAEQPTQITQVPPSVAGLAPGRSSDLVRGEAWAPLQPVVVEEIVSAADYVGNDSASCGVNTETARILNDAAALLSRSDVSYAGSFQGIQNLRSPAFVPQSLIAGWIGSINRDRSIPCHPLVAVIPAGSQIVGFKYSARDVVAEAPCNPDGNGWYVCGIGWSKFLGPPTVIPAGKSLLVTGMFMNWSHDRDRAANMTIYYRPAQ